ncbi:MAG TPA: TetR/AcrR family transcriptional regulator [Vicinamibacterales bacterium]|nr:TetR/AcrR family transcriptional regulator [Vicinamibacterales bacterium]
MRIPGALTATDLTSNQQKTKHLGVRERHDRERESVSRSILDAARELFVTEGYQHVSLRKIAERIEYSPAAIYGYFASKDDIFFALAEEGFRLLFMKASDDTDGHGDPVDDLRRMFWHYYEFSKSHPEYFALMFLDRTVPRISRDWERFGFIGEMKHGMVVRIQSAIDRGALPENTSPFTVFRILLTAIHGAAALRLCDRLGQGEDGDALAHAMLDTAIQGLKAGAATGLVLAPCPADPQD